MFAPAPALPHAFGRYQLLKLLGEGGTAEIFLARGGGGELQVIKRLRPELAEEPQFLAMLISEAKIAALLHHAGIVRVHELGREAGLIYLAMEYVPGWDLAAITRAAGGAIPPGVAARIGAAVAEALAHAHRRADLNGSPLHLVHRDVTPHNVMVTPGGEVKLIDFGVAKAAIQLTFTQPGLVKGKFRFMSPEQIEHHPLDGRSDLFSLGVSLYEVTTGRRPFARTQLVETFKAVLHDEPAPPSTLVPGYPAALEAVLERALVKDRDGRYPDGEAMAADLLAALPHIPGPGDVGAFVREVAAAHPDLLPAPALEPQLAPASLLAPPGPERRPDLVVVNLPEALEPVFARSAPPAPAAADPAWTCSPRAPAPAPTPRPVPARRGGRLATAAGLFALAAAAAAGTWLLLARLVGR